MMNVIGGLSKEVEGSLAPSAMRGSSTKSPSLKQRTNIQTPDLLVPWSPASQLLEL
jgi:hypothetical protein